MKGDCGVIDMQLPKRKPARLKEYDYSQNGAYFITICTHIIRDRNDYLKIWEYIDENPAKWQEDGYYM